MNEESTVTQATETKPKKNEFLELVLFAVLTLVIVIPIRMFIAQPFIVNGESMYPTFSNGDYLIVDEISYRAKDPERGDVIVFRFPKDKNRFLIKRIIALPGETLSLVGDKVLITTTKGESIELDEKYITKDFSANGRYELGEEDYFVMGDNRDDSSDSRMWGYLNKDRIIGKTFLRLFPLSTIDYKPGKIDAEDIEVKTLSV